MTPGEAPSTSGDQEHRCDVCGSDRAWFGFDLYRGTVWFCSEHRHVGAAEFRPDPRAKGEL